MCRFELQPQPALIVCRLRTAKRTAVARSRWAEAQRHVGAERSKKTMETRFIERHESSVSPTRGIELREASSDSTTGSGLRSKHQPNLGLRKTMHFWMLLLEQLVHWMRRGRLTPATVPSRPAYGTAQRFPTAVTPESGWTNASPVLRHDEFAPPGHVYGARSMGGPPEQTRGRGRRLR